LLIVFSKEGNTRDALKDELYSNPRDGIKQK
jgi:hypothetical protein